MKNKFEIVFKRLKDAKLDENILCSEFWRKIIELHRNFNKPDCWALMIDNIEWLINTGTMTTNDIKSWFTQEELNKNNIYTTGEVKIVDGFAIGMGDAKIDASGHSRVVLFDTAFAEEYDTTFITGFQNSSFVVIDCIGNAMGNCKAEANGLSIIENWTNNEVKKGVNCLIVNRE